MSINQNVALLLALCCRCFLSQCCVWNVKSVLLKAGYITRLYKVFEIRPFEQTGCVMLRSLPLKYECERICPLPDDLLFVDVGPGLLALLWLLLHLSSVACTVSKALV